MPAKLDPFGTATIIGFDNSDYLNKATKSALYTAGYTPMPSAYYKAWYSTTVGREQGQRLVDHINAELLQKKELLCSVGKRYPKKA